MENGKEKIIARIAADTSDKCAEIAAAAAKTAATIIREAEQTVELNRSAAETKCADNAKEIMRNRLSGAELDIRKYKLSKKRKLLEKVYEEAKTALTSSGQYQTFIEKNLARYAEKGEKIIFAKEDGKYFGKALLDKYGLCKADEYGDFVGGFVLQGKDYDKNLTLDVIIQEAKTLYETEIAKILFREEK